MMDDAVALRINQVVLSERMEEDEGEEEEKCGLLTVGSIYTGLRLCSNKCT